MSRTYRKESRRGSTGCRNHGSCSWCTGNRTIANQVITLKTKEELITTTLEGPEYEQGAYRASNIDRDESSSYLHDIQMLTSGETEALIEAGTTTAETRTVTPTQLKEGI